MKYEINIFQFQSKILIKQSEKYNTKWENNSCIGPDQVPRWGGGDMTGKNICDTEGQNPSIIITGDC